MLLIHRKGNMKRRSFVFYPKSLEFNQNPYDIYKIMREDYPYYRLANTWILTRYQDVSQFLKDKTLENNGIPRELIAEFLKKNVDVTDEAKFIVSNILLFQEGEIHSVHRRSLLQLFSGQGFERLKGIISEEAFSLINACKRHSEINIVARIAEPLWGRVFARWLNFTSEDAAIMEREKKNIRLLLDPSAITRQGLEQLVVTILNLSRLFNNDFERNRNAENPSLFYQALSQNNPEYSSVDFVIDAITVFIGGAETSGALITNVFYLLSEWPEEQEKLCVNPSLIRNLVQEVMRLEPPLQMTRRYVSCDFTYNDIQFTQGSNILLCLGAANHDASVFAEPETFQIERKNSGRHLGFGAGRHQCIGQFLAQLQAEIVCQLVLDNGGFIRKTPHGVSWQKESLIMRTPSTLFVAWERSQKPEEAYDLSRVNHHREER